MFFSFMYAGVATWNLTVQLVIVTASVENLSAAGQNLMCCISLMVVNNNASGKWWRDRASVYEPWLKTICKIIARFLRRMCQCKMKEMSSSMLPQRSLFIVEMQRQWVVQKSALRETKTVRFMLQIYTRNTCVFRWFCLLFLADTVKQHCTIDPVIQCCCI